jgi:hypothetical protein
MKLPDIRSWGLALAMLAAAGCSSEKAEAEVGSLSSPVVEINSDLARDHVDARGAEWRFVSAKVLREINGELKSWVTKPVAGEGDVDELIAGGLTKLRQREGVVYEYSSEIDAGRYLERMQWYAERPPRERESDPAMSPDPDSLEGQYVIPLDGRVEVGAPYADFPWTATGNLHTSSGGSWATMFMIDSHAAIASAHQFWDRDEDEAYSWGYVRFGNDNGTYASQQAASDFDVVIPTAYKTSEAYVLYDIAIITFDNDFAEEDTGWYGIDPTPSTSWIAWGLTGYPSSIAAGGFVEKEQAHGTTSGSAVVQEDDTNPNWYLIHFVDMSGGNSGGAVRTDATYYAVSVNSISYESNNCPQSGYNNCNAGPRLGSIWLPVIEANTDWEPDGWGGTSPYDPF